MVGLFGFNENSLHALFLCAIGPLPYYGACVYDLFSVLSEMENDQPINQKRKKERKTEKFTKQE